MYERQRFSLIRHFANSCELSSVVSQLSSDSKKIFHKNYGQSPIHIISELASNIEEHSEFSIGSIMAGQDKERKFMEIAFLDDGVSIPGSFEKYGHNIEKDHEVISNTLKGRSTKQSEGGRGWGLTTSKNMVLNGLNGKLQIISRKGIVLSGKKSILRKRTIGNAQLNGTLIYLKAFKPKKKIFDIYPYIEKRG